MQNYEIIFSRYITYEAPESTVGRGTRVASYPVHVTVEGIVPAFEKAKDILLGLCQADKTSNYSIISVKCDSTDREMAENASPFDIFGLETGDSK